MCLGAAGGKEWKVIMDKTLLAAYVLMHNQDEREKKYNPDHEFDVDKRAHWTDKGYLNELHAKWSAAADLRGLADFHIEPSDYKDYESYKKAVDEYVERIKR